MTAPRFFLDDGELAAGADAALSVDDSRHALRALRLRHGEAVTVSDDRGRVGHGTLAGERDGRAIVAIATVERVERARPAVTVALVPPKGERLSWAVQKLAEVGVDAVRLVSSDRAVRLVGESDVARLRRVAHEASMQSRRAFRPAIAAGDAPTPDGEASSARIVLHQGADVALRDGLPDAPPQAIELVVGPEGGFTDAEVERELAGAATVVSLGEGILRAETAAVVAASLVLFRYGRLG